MTQTLERRAEDVPEEGDPAASAPVAEAPVEEAPVEVVRRAGSRAM